MLCFNAHSNYMAPLEIQLIWNGVKVCITYHGIKKEIDIFQSVSCRHKDASFIILNDS